MSSTFDLKKAKMRPSEKFKAVICLMRLCAKFCGADIADPNYKPNIITYLGVFVITVYFIFSVYTVHIKIHEGWGILLQSFCMVGSVFQGISKLLCGIVYSKYVSENDIFLTTLYTKYELKSEEYNGVLSKCVSRIGAAVKYVAGIYSVTIRGLIVIPLVKLALTGHRTFPMQYYLPLVDVETTFGYFATVSLQSTCLFFGAFGNFAGDMFMMVFFAHIPLFVDILNLKIMELNELTEDLENPMVMEMLLDVLKWHQIYSNYTETIDNNFFWINFTQITTSALSIVFTLFIMFTADWTGLYLYIVLCFSMMYLYCGMGTLVGIANDDIAVGIYNIHWYNMSVSHQKIMGFMLMKSQSPQEVSVGGVMPMSVSTGLQVTKTVYSIFMMLLNFFS